MLFLQFPDASLLKYTVLKQAALRADPSLATSRYVNRAALPMDGWTPLHAAAARGNLDFVKVCWGFFLHYNGRGGHVALQK